MLEEAVEVMRLLWRGEICSFDGKHYRLEDARIYTLPSDPIEVVVAASAPESAELAARIGDGLVSTAPDGELVDAYVAAGGDGPRCAQLTVCWAETQLEARRTALEWWPNAGLEGPLSQELPRPGHSEAAAGMVSEDDVAEKVICRPDPEKHVEGISTFLEAASTTCTCTQVGSDQDGFFDFYGSAVLPELAGLQAASAGKRDAGSDQAGSTSSPTACHEAMIDSASSAVCAGVERRSIPSQNSSAQITGSSLRTRSSSVHWIRPSTTIRLSSTGV